MKHKPMPVVDITIAHRVLTAGSTAVEVIDFTFVFKQAPDATTEQVILRLTRPQTEAMLQSLQQMALGGSRPTTH